MFFLLCHSGARPRNPGDARETRVQKYFDNFIVPVPACAGMTKRGRGNDKKEYDLGPGVKHRDDKGRIDLGPGVKPRDDKEKNRRGGFN